MTLCAALCLLYRLSIAVVQDVGDGGAFFGELFEIAHDAAHLAHHGKGVGVLFNDGGQGGGLSGQTTDIKIHAEHMVYIRDKMNRMLSEYTGQPLEKIQQDTERDNYLTAQQAKEYGLIDEVIAHR